MIAVIDKPTLLFDEFIDWYPDQSGDRYELRRGLVIEKLAVEVVSTHWRDDYLFKLADYEAFGIQEYWIVDYLGIGGRRYIGTPKQPAFTVCTLVDGEYEMQKFRGDDFVISSTFPTLQLAVAQMGI